MDDMTFWCFECNRNVRDESLEKIKSIKLAEDIQKLSIGEEKIEADDNKKAIIEDEVEDEVEENEEETITLEEAKEDKKRTITLEKIVENLTAGNYKKVIVLAGAGISVNAGIPDFKTPGSGIYSNLAKYNLSRPELLYTISYFKKHPEAFYDHAQEVLAKKYLPTKTHYFIRLLQDKGLLVRAYTQNMDGLEVDAGIKAELLIQAHGSAQSAHCSGCNIEVKMEEMIEAIKSGIPKYCNECKAPCKPDIVFFDEALPDRFFDSIEEIKTNCDLLIIMGTSLSVTPFSSLPLLPPKNVPRLILNIQVPELFKVKTKLLHLHLKDDCDTSVEKLVKMLKWDKDFEVLMKEREECAKKDNLLLTPKL